jgi:hypothetical protein
MFQKVEQHCDIQTSPSCGFHVHICPLSDGGWTPDNLKQLCRAIIYFEAAFELLVPNERRGNQYAKSNSVDNPKLTGKTFETMLECLSDCDHKVHVADLMNNDGDRFFSWNLPNMYYGRIGTVEFRRGPGITNSAHAQQWAALVLGFAEAALSTTPTMLLSYPRDVAGLAAFINSNLPPWFNNGLLGSLFAGKSGSVAPRPVGPLSQGESRLLSSKRDEAERKNIIRKKMER